MHVLVERLEIWDQAGKAVQDRLGAVRVARIHGLTSPIWGPAPGKRCDALRQSPDHDSSFRTHGLPIGPFARRAKVPWKECNLMDERHKFIARLLNGEREDGGAVPRVRHFP